ncbi:hypothetical protein H2204_000674 [Knufia peltigerae]|uniref:Uncharacterized protein n=1 Tax=Knufia peltigerae TaxID=1002370 RepID=A0AA38YEE7_9EURO|nr:hypothetical protein H2204_000674 [Knufia peltigerae]
MADEFCALDEKGGGSGFGAATVLLFASEGARVLIADMNEEAAKKVAASANSANNGSVVYQKANVASRQSWVELVERIEKDFGGQLDILVNNAGTSYPYKPTLEVTEEEYDMTMNVNCKSIFWSINVCVPAMLKAGRGGSIVNTASIGAMRPRPGLVWYAASKGTVANATKGLAAEFAPMGIRVNSVSPLIAATGLWEKFSGVPDTPENRAKFTSGVPMGRLVEPEEVANAILFLASDESAFIVGEDIKVDGGKTI